MSLPRDVSSDVGRFRAPEGLFNLSVWGMDNPPLHKLVQKAVQACPMDTRREMWRLVKIITLTESLIDLIVFR